MLIGESPAFAAAKRLISRFADCDAPVIIGGETGTGKELAARAIHYQGSRRDRPFVPMNCGAFPEGLIENELFGHKRGAFTDARTDSPGLLRLADRGTLFLDEIDSLAPRAQCTLLRFLQDRRYRPLGSSREETVDVRIIAASNRDLSELADGGAFRADLLFRLRLLSLSLPPLRERSGDPELLAEHFLQECRRRYGRPAKRMHHTFRAFINVHPWPGNVRELENFVHREYLLSDEAELVYAGPGEQESERDVDGRERPGPVDVFSSLQAIASYRDAKAHAIEQFDREFLNALLVRTGGNVSRAARISGKERRALGKLLKKYGIEPISFRDA
jgi:two-component system response regulator GlrR